MARRRENHTVRQDWMLAAGGLILGLGLLAQGIWAASGSDAPLGGWLGYAMMVIGAAGATSALWDMVHLRRKRRRAP